MSRSAKQRTALFFLWIAAAITLALLILIIGHVLVRGVGQIDWDFLTQNPRQAGKMGGIRSTIIGTAYLTAVALAIATPIGVAAAIYLTEYVKQSPFVRLIRFGTEALAGIPSIVFGLFGYSLFVEKLHWGWSVRSGGATLALMVLPFIIRTSEEAIKAVPRSYREGSLALGATQWQTIRRVVLPSAIPGIMTGVILAIGRAVGETAAVLLTAGSPVFAPTSLSDPARSMAVHLYYLASENLSMERSYGTAAVLVFLILGINVLAGQMAKHWATRGAGTA